MCEGGGKIGSAGWPLWSCISTKTITLKFSRVHNHDGATEYLNDINSATLADPDSGLHLPGIPCVYSAHMKASAYIHV